MRYLAGGFQGVPKSDGIHVCFLHTHSLKIIQTHFQCVCILTGTHHLRSGMEFSTSGVMLVLRKFQIWISNA
jgi:hypothetical protein